MSIVGLLIVLILFFVIYWAIHKLGAAFGAPAQVLAVVDVLLVVLFVLYALQELRLIPYMR